MHIPKWLIVAAGLLVVVLIAAVAFFVGRETSAPPAAATGVAAGAAAAVPQEPSAVSGSASEGPRVPLAEAPGPITPITTPSAGADAPSYATTSRTSAPGAVTDNSRETTEARARVTAYFRQMEAIRSGGTIAGDQQEFATTIVNATASGDFSGIDELVRAASDAERRAAALQPPSECADYHRMATTLLQESRTMITALRDGLKRNDTGALTSLATSAQNMKSRAERLADAEKSLRARFGL
jgi:hypothetical protein